MSPLFIDSHAHLDFDDYRAELGPVLERAEAVGLTHIVCIGASRGLEPNYQAVELAAKHAKLWATVGVHPHDGRIVDQSCLDVLEVLAQKAKVVAIGETGLDYHYLHSTKEEQIAAFRAQLGIARRRGLPVVIHTREAEEDTEMVLRSEHAKDIGGVFHCFTGTQRMAKVALDLGFYLSFSGVLTFRSAEELRGIAKNLPRDRVLIETDCPFLTPVPLRGKRNEPSFIVHTAAKLAELWGVPLDEVKTQTAENTLRLFRLPRS